MYEIVVTIIWRSLSRTHPKGYMFKNAKRTILGSGKAKADLKKLERFEGVYFEREKDEACLGGSTVGKLCYSATPLFLSLKIDASQRFTDGRRSRSP